MTPSQADVSIVRHFAELPDPRREHTRLHDLLDILVIALCAVLSGAEGWEDIETYGRAKFDWLATFLSLPNGIPSHDTFRRVFGLLDPGAFGRCFSSWIEALHTTLGIKRIALDGKTLRRSFDRGKGQGPLHLISAWATEQGLSLGQVAVDAKSNEITALPQLLALLDVSGAIVTVDAMGCQKEVAKKIREEGGDYVLTVKGNQERLLEDLQQCFARGIDTDFAGMTYSFHETTTQGHGRKETRCVHTIQNPEGIRDAALWPDLTAITLVISERQVGDEPTTTTARYVIGSRAAPAEEYATFIRGHWGIENSLHWILDVIFGEDDSRIRTGNGPANMALLRRLAVSLLKRNPKNGSVRKQRLQNGWDDRYLERTLNIT